MICLIFLKSPGIFIIGSSSRLYSISNFLRGMQLRKRDKIKKNIDVVINKDKNIIWNIDFSDDPEIATKAPESLLESLENCISRFEENLKNKASNSAKIEENMGKKELKRIAKKILKVKKLKLGEIAQKVSIFS